MRRVLPVSLRPALSEHAERLRAGFGERLVEQAFAEIEPLMERVRQLVLDSHR